MTSTSGKVIFGDKLLFTADSPLFAKSVSDYGRDLNGMTTYLSTLSKTMKSYVNQIKNLSVIGDKMATQMRTGFPTSSNDANSNSMMITARSVADLLCDLSQSQEILALTLEQSFCEPLDNLCINEATKVINMQQQYQTSRDTNDTVMMKYIQSDGHIKGINVATLDLRAYEIALQKRRFELSRYDLVAGMNKLDNKKILDVSEAFVSTWVLIRAHYNHCSDRFQSSSKYLHELNVRQQNLNDEFLEKYSKPDEKR